MMIFVPFSWMEQNGCGISEVLWQSPAGEYDENSLMAVVLSSSTRPTSSVATLAGFALLYGIHWDIDENELPDTVEYLVGEAYEVRTVDETFIRNLEEGYLCDEATYYTPEDFASLAKDFLFVSGL